MIELDHIAIAAETLEEGRAKVEDALGVVLQQGGQHAHFGTHNLLLGLEDGLYLEVISVDPAAPQPGYPRWFDLDRFRGAPRVTNWICRTTDMKRTLQQHPAAGSAVALARGDLRWQMAVPEDGILPFGGVFPALIEWEGGAHPAPRLAASGCRLERLCLAHPDIETLTAQLAPDLFDDRVVFNTGAPSIRAEFSTPNGRRVLA